MLSGCSFQSTEEDEIETTIKGFYGTQYKSYLDMEYNDIESYLDMEKIQNKNKVIALKELSFRRKYLDENDYSYVEKERFPVEYQFNDMNIENDTATITVNIVTDDKNAYPPFIISGENIFTLNKIDGVWKITDHQYEGIRMFEQSTTELLPEYNEERIKSKIDEEFK